MCLGVWRVEGGGGILGYLFAHALAHSLISPFEFLGLHVSV